MAEAPTPPSNAPRKTANAPKSWPFLPDYQGAHVMKTVHVHADESWKMLEGTFDVLSRAVFYGRFFSRLMIDQATAESMMGYVKGRFDFAEDEISRKSAIASEALEKEGKEGISYKTPAQRPPKHLKIIDPLMNRFVDVVVKADDYFQKLLYMWFLGLLKDDQFQHLMDDGHEIVRTLLREVRNHALDIRDEYRVQRRRKYQQAQPQQQQDMSRQGPPKQRGKSKQGQPKRQDKSRQDQSQQKGKAQHEQPQGSQQPIEEKQAA